MSANIKNSKNSRREIEKLLTSLPEKIQKLLDKCVGMEPYYVPDYVTFRLEAAALLEPIFRYCDDIFHSTGEMPEFFQAALRAFSEKKAEYDSKLKKMNAPPDEKENKVQMDFFMRFKLLLDFFGYTEPSPDNILQMYDLEYQLEKEQNPERRQELLDSFALVAEGTSSHQFYCAMQAKEDGDLEKALKYCEKAIQKFLGNTPAYILKREIHLELARKTVDEGLIQEPRDEALKFIRDLDENVRKLRLQLAKGQIDSNDLIAQVERFVEERIQCNKFALAKYENAVNRTLFQKNSIEEKTLKLMSTGEFLLENLFEPLDFAPSAIEFCKAVENELCVKIFEPFKNSTTDHLGEYENPGNENWDYFLWSYVNGKEKINLGSMAMILQYLGSAKKLRKSEVYRKLREFVEALPNPQMLMDENGVRANLTPQLVNEYRNSSAHLETFTKSKASETRVWSYNIINLLIKATNMTSKS